MRKTLEAIAGAVLPDDAWAQACLPLGPGLGLLTVQMLSKFSFATSWHAFVTADFRAAACEMPFRSGQFVGSTAGVAAAEARALVTEANEAQLAPKFT